MNYLQYLEQVFAKFIATIKIVNQRLAFLPAGIRRLVIVFLCLYGFPLFLIIAKAKRPQQLALPVAKAEDVFPSFLLTGETQMNINTYAKFAPTVFVAKCPEAHTKGDVIVLTSKHGNETEVVVHNLVKQADGFFFYSFTRCDGMDSQDFAQRRAERYQGYADNALKRSEKHWAAANEGRDFLSLGEPIKIGHHSEKRHRALIERNARRMDKAVEESNKAESYDGRIAYWERMAGKIDLSMPESLGYFQFELAKAKEKHQELKDYPEKRDHAFSLTYAKKAVNELDKKVKLAQLLWA